MSYNVLPGFAPFLPIRNLMARYAKSLGTNEPLADRISKTLDFADQLMESEPKIGKATPTLHERIKAMREKSPEYIAHEYFNSIWDPIDFATMDDWLSSAKLSFACSAKYLEHVDVIHLTAEQQHILASIQDPVLRETTRDIILNHQFRRDYWVKGPRKLKPLEVAEQLRALNVVLTQPADSIEYKVKGCLGEAKLNEAVYNTYSYRAEHPQGYSGLLSGRNSSYIEYKHRAADRCPHHLDWRWLRCSRSYRSIKQGQETDCKHK